MRPWSLAITLVAISLMFGAAASGPAVAAPGDALVVRGDVVNVRTGPSTTNTVEMRVFRDQLVIERQRAGDWVEVEIAGAGGRHGWIHGFLVAEPGGRRLAEPLELQVPVPQMPAPRAAPKPVAPIARSPAVAPPKPAPPAAAPVAIAAAKPVEPAAGGPIEPLTEPESAAIELPNLAIAAGTPVTKPARAAPATTVAALPKAATSVVQPIPPRRSIVAPVATPAAAPRITAPAPPVAAPAASAPAASAPAGPAPAPPAPESVAALPPTTAAPASIEPAAAPVDPGLERFRQSVTYLNTRAMAVAGVDLFTGVEAAGGGVVKVLTTDAWETIPPAGRESYLNALVDRWAASRTISGPVQVQIVDATGQVMVERGKP